MKSGSLNFLEPSGQLQACNGTPLPFTSDRNYEFDKTTIFIEFPSTYFKDLKLFLISNVYFAFHFAASLILPLKRGIVLSYALTKGTSQIFITLRSFCGVYFLFVC